MSTHQPTETAADRRRMAQQGAPASANGRPKAPRPVPGFPERTKGLCVNCVHRLMCPYPLPEGGVWHCEEYA